MRTAVLEAAQRFRVSDVPTPEPGPGQVRIRLEGCGVCGSNLPVWEGRPWFQYPLSPGSPGHEGWGVIDAIGPDVRGVQPGERVAAITQHAFAEADLAAADAVVPLPGAAPFPGEPLGCVLNVFRRSDIGEGQTVAIVGIGFLGALLTQLAAAEGARVIALSRRPFSLDVAKQCGAAETVQLGDPHQAVARVGQLTGGEWCDRVIEATGLQAPLDVAGEITRVRGRLSIAGYHQDGLRQVNMQLWNWRGLDVVNAHERDPQAYTAGIRLAVEALAEGRIDPTPLYTHRYGLDELDDALGTMRERPDGFLKALVLV